MGGYFLPLCWPAVLTRPLPKGVCPESHSIPEDHDVVPLHFMRIAKIHIHKDLLLVGITKNFHFLGLHLVYGI